MVDISIDIETFSSEPGASIAAIGAADSEGERLYVTVDDPTGRFSPGTIRWHAQQPDPLSSTGSDLEPRPLDEALTTLASYLSHRQASKEGAVRLWAHAGFDLPQLDAAFRRIGWRRPPWHYRNQRDLRTLYDLAGGRPKVPNRAKHNALADAEAQLEEVRVCLDRIYRPRPGEGRDG